MVTTITDSEKKTNKKKGEKKSFWFEFAEEQGVNPHKSAWTEFHQREKEEKRAAELGHQRFCTQCGGNLPRDSKFCQRCGHRIR